MDNIREQGSRTLHPCCTTNQHFMTTNSINCDEATYQASRIVMSQINFTVASLRDCSCRHPLSCHLAEAETKRTNFFINAKCPNQATTHTNTHSVIYIRVQARLKIFLRYACNTLTTLYETG